VIEWALRRAAAAEPSVELRAGVRVTGLLTSEDGAPRATGVAVEGGDPVRGDLVVDALGRYRCPPGWPRAAGEPSPPGPPRDELLARLAALMPGGGAPV
jgi:hypothetical protein